MTVDQSHARLDSEREREVKFGVQYWPMELRETGEFAGCAGLRPWQYSAETMEVGVHLMRSAWGGRLGEEALRAVLAHGFETLGLPVVVAGHGAGHQASRSNYWSALDSGIRTTPSGGRSRWMSTCMPWMLRIGDVGTQIPDCVNSIAICLNVLKRSAASVKSGSMMQDPSDDTERRPRKVLPLLAQSVRDRGGSFN